MVSTKKGERNSMPPLRPLDVNININESIPDVGQNLSGILKSHIKTMMTCPGTIQREN
jgi:hypothetical protein